MNPTKKQYTKVTDLKEGEVRIVSIRQSTTPEKIMIEFVEGKVNPQTGLNALAVMNATDERFTNGGVRDVHHWLTAQKDLASKLGITKDMIKGAEEAYKSNDFYVLPKALVNPKLEDKRLVIKQSDSYTPWSDYQRNNPEQTAKKFINTKTEEAVFYTGIDEKDGKRKLIFQETTLITEDVREKENAAHKSGKRGYPSDNIFTTEREDRMSWDEFSAVGYIPEPTNAAEEEDRLAARRTAKKP